MEEYPLDESSRTAHSKTLALGLALMGAALLAMLVAFLSTIGFDDEINPFIGIAVLLVVVTFLVWRFDALWSRVLGLVAAVGLFAMIWFFAFGIFQIFSRWSSSPAWHSWLGSSSL